MNGPHCYIVKQPGGAGGARVAARPRSLRSHGEEAPLLRALHRGLPAAEEDEVGAGPRAGAG